MDVVSAYFTVHKPRSFNGQSKQTCSWLAGWHINCNIGLAANSNDVHFVAYNNVETRRVCVLSKGFANM
jgi:hypothetical protein